MEKKNYRVILCRGVAGSGKSFTADKIREELEVDCIICSADDYFVLNGDGKYKFDPAKLEFAHKWCQNIFEQALSHRVGTIIVDNTNTTVNEAFFYVNLAKEYGYSVEVIEPSTKWAFDERELFRRNTHGVPMATIQKMLNRYVPAVEFKKKLGLE